MTYNLAKARENVPLGSQWGAWTVTSEPFTEGTSSRGATYVMARCACGNERRVNLYGLTKGLSVRCQPCGARASAPWRGRAGSAHHSWKGDSHQRDPYEYQKRFVQAQGGLCAWPPCQTLLAGRIAIDHRHDKCCPGDKTCLACVRGAVHHLCNVLHIAGVERAIALGGVMPSHIEAYLYQLDSTSNQEAA